MVPHKFLLEPTSWMGDGTILLNMVEEKLNFFTRWNISDKDFAGKIHSVQEIQIAGISENMRNELSFFDFSSKTFAVEMENVNIGKVLGKGIFDEKMVAWEFRRNHADFEGFEIYHLQEDGTYLVHAEYVTSDQFRTQITGKIWKVPSPSEEKGDKEDE